MRLIIEARLEGEGIDPTDVVESKVICKVTAKLSARDIFVASEFDCPALSIT